MSWDGNPHTIARIGSPVQQVRVADGEWERVPYVRRCNSPVQISWQGGPIRLEVRDVCDDDRLIWSDHVGRRGVSDNSVVLIVKDGLRVSTEPNEVPLPQVGLYRVKLFSAVKRKLLDPLLELWLHVDDS